MLGFHRILHDNMYVMKNDWPKDEISMWWTLDKEQSEFLTGFKHRWPPRNWLCHLTTKPLGYSRWTVLHIARIRSAESIMTWWTFKFSEQIKCERLNVWHFTSVEQKKIESQRAFELMTNQILVRCFNFFAQSDSWSWHYCITQFVWQGSEDQELHKVECFGM